MSKYRFEKVTCEECGEEFEIKIYDSVNKTLNPELVDQIITGEIYNHKCPNCGANYEFVNEILYNDMDKKVMIQSGALEDLILVKRKEDGIKGLFNMAGYKIYGATSPFDLSSMILGLKYDIDPNILEIYKINSIVAFKEKYNKQLKEKIDYDDFYFADSDEGLFLVYEKNGEIFSMPIKKELCDKLKTKYDTELFFADLIVTNKKSISKFLKTVNKKEQYQNIFKFAICIDKHNRKHIATILNHKKDEYKENDHVVIINENKDFELIPAKILTIFEMPEYNYPYYTNSMPYIAYKTGTIDIKDEENNTNNDMLRLALEAYKANKCNSQLFPLELFLKSNCLLGIYFDSFDSNESNLSNIKHVSDTKYVKYYDDDKKYLALFLDDKDIPNDAPFAVDTFKISDALDLFFNQAGSFDGIIINPEKEAIKLSTKKILEQKADLIMTRMNNFIEFLDTLTVDEVETLGVDRFNVIYDIYKNNLKIEGIKEKYNLTTNDLDDRLGYGYRLIKRIIYSKILENKDIYH